MINKFLCLLVITIFSFSVKAQDETRSAENLRSELFATYGYCSSQKWSLEEIAKKFPQLRAEILSAEAQFDITFGASCRNVQEMINKMLGGELGAFDKTLKEKLADSIDYSQLTLKGAQDYAATVRDRAKGNIVSPYKEILLAFNPAFEENPASEFSRGFTRKYRTQNDPKAKGLDFEISVPVSWKGREGRRPNIIQFFSDKNGYGDASLSLLVMEIPLPPGVKLTQKDIDSVFTPAALKELVPENGTFIEGKSIVLEGQKGGMIIYDMVEQRLDLKIKVRFLSYVVYYNNRLIILQFGTSGKVEDTASLVKDFNKNRPLFQLIANSLVIMNKYK